MSGMWRRPGQDREGTPRGGAVVAASILAGMTAFGGLWSLPTYAQECLTRPGKATTGHWYYRIDRSTKRKCWYLGQAGYKGRQVARKRSPVPQARPAPKQPPPNAMALHQSLSILNPQDETKPIPQRERAVRPSMTEPVSTPDRSADHRWRTTFLNEPLQVWPVLTASKPAPTNRAPSSNPEPLPTSPRAADELLHTRAADELLRTRGTDGHLTPRAADEHLSTRAAEELLATRVADELLSARTGDQHLGNRAGNEQLNKRNADEHSRMSFNSEPPLVWPIRGESDRTTASRSMPGYLDLLAVLALALGIGGALFAYPVLRRPANAWGASSNDPDQTAEYVSALSRLVADLDPDDAQARRAAYDRARRALIDGLQTIDPPLPKATMAVERSAFEAAIRRIEAQRARPDAVFLRLMRRAWLWMGLDNAGARLSEWAGEGGRRWADMVRRMG